MLKALKDILDPLQVATTYVFSAEYNVPVSPLYPALHGLLKPLKYSDDNLSSKTCHLFGTVKTVH